MFHFLFQNRGSKNPAEYATSTLKENGRIGRQMDPKNLLKKDIDQ
jgi:hypothetical protein